MKKTKVTKLLIKINQHIKTEDVYAVGGCVRDILLKRPIKDIDITSKYTPEEIKSMLPYKSIDTGLQHGTVTFLIDGEHIEHTTFRKDTDTDGRHAEVEFTDSMEEDSLRRDFTINAMYMDVNGKVYDFHTGLADIELGEIRCVGKAQHRIEEDYLRIMRAFRFAQRYDFSIDSELRKVIKSHTKQLFDKVSSERIFSEIDKMIKETYRVPAFLIHTIFSIDRAEVTLDDIYSISDFNGFLHTLFISLHEDDNSREDLLNKLPLTIQQKKYILFFMDIKKEGIPGAAWKHRQFIASGYGDLNEHIHGFIDAMEFTKRFPKYLKGKEIGDWQKNTFLQKLTN